MLARSREHMTRRGVGRWWWGMAPTCLNRKWAHLCELAGGARGAWEREQEPGRGREQEREWERERERGRGEDSVG